MLEERSSYGGLPWIKVKYPAGEGWLLQTQVYRQSEPPVAYITPRGGTNLRDRPQGGIEQVLFDGTPILSVGDTAQVGGLTWVEVEVLDGAVGWVVAEKLTSAADPD
jgi:hypothetical protein